MRRVARRADGWLAVGAPPSVLGYLWSTIRREAEDAGRDPAEIRFIVRMNPHLTDEKAEAEKVPSKGTMDQVIAYARSLVEVGADEVFIDLGQTARSAAEVLDRAGAFYDGVRAG
jgi:alkanesulfonate monooxygenase SsuD/methylene tetrahydromethanopterin reductase-like flavin-dependent oxidoreductase (luciferase family)